MVIVCSHIFPRLSAEGYLTDAAARGELAQVRGGCRDLTGEILGHLYSAEELDDDAVIISGQEGLLLCCGGAGEGG